jgi:Flp pilus assembly pilin Flp
MRKSMFKCSKKEKGQTVLEYSLIIAVLVLVIISVIPTLRNSVRGVFLQVETALENAEELAVQPSQEDHEYWNSLDQEEWYDQWYSTETRLGQGVHAISIGLAEIMIEYKNETNSWLPMNDYDGQSWDLLNQELSLGWTEEEVNMWKRSTNVDGVLYTPFNNKISVEPGEGYYFTFEDTQGESHTMDYVMDGNGLLSNQVNLVLDDGGSWRAYWKVGGNRPVNIDTLRVHVGLPPTEP